MMKTAVIFQLFHHCSRQNRLLSTYFTLRRSNPVRFYSATTDTERPFVLGNFDEDLKPYLRTRKKRKFHEPPVHEKFKNQEPIIKCKDPTLNHYRSIMYGKFDVVPLASQNWRSYKSVGDHFSINVHKKDEELKDLSERKMFNESDLQPEIIDILNKHNIKKMSEVQEHAIPSILKGRNTLLAAETGCGKTLAYLLPLIQNVLTLKKSTKSEFNAPFVIILTPSRELVEQIREIMKWFEPLGISCGKILGGFFHSKIMNPVVRETDFLISTVGAVRKFVFAGTYSLKNVQCVVLDEADALLDDSFNEITTDFLRRFPIRSKPAHDEDTSGTQLILVSATMPTSLSDILGDIVDLDFLNIIKTKNLHKAMPNVVQKFWRVNRSTKPAYLLQIVKGTDYGRSPIIVFCNNVETSVWVSSFLRDNNVENILLNKEMGLKSRRDQFKRFQDGEAHVLVCTSIASRGLDTCRVERILNYNFPSFIADYIHRCGRTGRLGCKSKGRVYNLISGKNEIELVQMIETCVRRTIPFENVNPNIRKIIKYKGKHFAENDPLQDFDDDESNRADSSSACDTESISHDAMQFPKTGPFN